MNAHYACVYLVSLAVEKMNERGISCKYYPDFESALEYLKTALRPGDLFITMGAGDVNKLAHMYLEDK